MREIKFRAYLTLSGYDDEGNDKDYHAMATEISVHNDGGIGFSRDHGYEIFGDAFEQAEENGTVNEYEEWCNWEGPFELMQYTGLNDKNGVKIFEGDKVALDMWHGNEQGYIPEDGVIKWHQPSSAFKWFSLEQDPSDGNNYWLSQADEKQREVFGNIYQPAEQTDLLK